MDKCLSSCLSHWQFVTFLPAKQHLSPAKNKVHYFVVFKKKNHCDGQLSQPRLSELLKTASLPTRDKVRQRPVPPWLFWIRSASLLCELPTGAALCRSCLALCEQPTAENWQTSDVVIMWRLSVKRALNPVRGVSPNSEQPVKTRQCW